MLLVPSCTLFMLRAHKFNPAICLHLSAFGSLGGPCIPAAGTFLAFRGHMATCWDKESAATGPREHPKVTTKHNNDTTTNLTLTSSLTSSSSDEPIQSSSECNRQHGRNQESKTALSLSLNGICAEYIVLNCILSPPTTASAVNVPTYR